MINNEYSSDHMEAMFEKYSTMSKYFYTFFEILQIVKKHTLCYYLISLFQNKNLLHTICEHS